MTLGQVAPGLVVDLAVGDFKGYIDEVRLWSRPHNPTIIANNFRIVITDDTSDVSHSWNFNEGFGLTAREKKKGDNMIVVSVSDAPVWVTSDLILSLESDLDLPKLTTEDGILASVITTAQTTCNSLLTNFTTIISSSDSSNLADYTSLCISELTLTGDISQAAVILASAADEYMAAENTTVNPLEELCSSLESIDSYCSACEFGTMIGGVCVCEDSHSGSNCDTICPVGPLGACNTFGICESGKCHCDSQNYGASITAETYWTNFLTSTNINVTANYSCGQCSESWVGKDCKFSQSTAVSTSFFTGIVYGSYITTLSGISFSVVTPGVYTLMQTAGVSVQVLFVPCLGSITCRYMKEMSIKSGGSMVVIQHVSDTEISIKSDSKELTYPADVSSGMFTVSWKNETYIRVTFGSSSILVCTSNIGLVTMSKIAAADAGSSTGILGSTAGTWISDLNCEIDTTTITEETELMTEYVGQCLKQRYSPATSDIFLEHTDSYEGLSSAGYYLLLLDQTLTVSTTTLTQSLTKFTFGFWSKSAHATEGNLTASVFTIFTLVTSTSTMNIVVNQGHVEIIWDQTYVTTITYPVNTWSYIALSWSDTGSLAIYQITKLDNQQDTFTDVKIGGVIDLQDITMTTNAEVSVGVDCVRVWSDIKTLEAVVVDMGVYCDVVTTDTGLLSSLALDEGTGEMFNMTVHSTDGTTSLVVGYINGKYESLVVSLTIL